MEGIIKNRIEEHMRDGGQDLSDNQYGFRRERLTVDAITRVRDIVREKHERGIKVLTMSIDIKTRLIRLNGVRFVRQSIRKKSRNI